MSADSPQASKASPATQVRNLLIVLVAIALSVALVLGLRTQTSTASLGTLAANATPLEVAQTNNKPTLMEFYANWCTSCQAMAGDMTKLKQQYGDRVNFVMLNVDNTKWLPEVLNYRVDGIPHFVFLDPQGQELASAIGQQPLTLMSASLSNLVANLPLSDPAIAGETSAFTAPVKPNQDDPRSHGGLPS
ncbi:MAG: thioredoxin family protein [Aphanocapsa sp. GSE-SYN-MK-11-07L]|nr:thioredoxin family protein [Aphanocapsa sp. GSE-SYN-MK-11-07L]